MSRPASQWARGVDISACGFKRVPSVQTLASAVGIGALEADEPMNPEAVNDLAI